MYRYGSVDNSGECAWNLSWMERDWFPVLMERTMVVGNAVLVRAAAAWW